MKVLLLGATGMLGHKLAQLFSRSFEVCATIRSAEIAPRYRSLFDGVPILTGVAADDFQTVAETISQSRPAVIVNCIGIIKQSDEAKDPITSIGINSLFPHLLARVCQQQGIRLIHISTDCVFSGRKGAYTEEDPSDAEDLYGRTKFLGEAKGGKSLTLRTSIIGRELQSSLGLIEWFLSQNHRTVSGFSNAIFSGLTTISLGAIIERIILDHPLLQGLWHVSSAPVSKLDLLTLVKNAYQLDIKIIPQADFKCDRSLDSTQFKKETGINIPSWPDMIRQMQADPTPYPALRGETADEKNMAR